MKFTHGIALLLMWSLSNVWAQQVETPAQDPALEKRVMGLAAELRCVVCQNQSLADSHAELAIDLRQQMREMMVEGKSNSQIVDYFVARYGDFVRYRPPMNSSTALLWFGPLILLIIGALVLFFSLKKRGRNIADAAVLTEEERRQAAVLLAEPSPTAQDTKS